MEKIKPSKLAECQKQASGFDVEVPQEINKKDDSYYHLLLVEKVHRRSQQRYDDRSTVIKMNQTDYFTKITGKSTKGSSSNTMALLGYTNLFVLHDPNFKPAPKKRAAKKQIEEPNKTEEA